MQAALAYSSANPPAPLIGAGPVNGRRANAPIHPVATARFTEQLDPTDASSVAERAVSHTELDRARSKIGPGAVQDIAELETFLRQRHPQKTWEHVAFETGVKMVTLKKWFFKKVQYRHTPKLFNLTLVADAYGDELASQAGLPILVWRDAFLAQAA